MDGGVAVAPRTKRVPRGRLAVLVGALVASPLLCELGLRWCLFGTSDLARSVGSDLRRAGLYVPTRFDERYWKLTILFDPELEERYETVLELDPLLGWRNGLFVPPDYAHPLEGSLGSRRPVVFYGASFVQPALAAHLHQGPLDDRFGLLTYGVNAWGMGQCWLLMQASLRRFDGRDPIVLLGMQVEADLDRPSLTFRNAAKPSFALDESGSIVVEPFEPARVRDHLAEHPVGIRSFVWAWLTGPKSPLPGVRERHAEERREHEDQALALHEKLLVEMRLLAESIGGSFALVVFHDADVLQPDSERSELERALLAFCERSRIPYLDTRLVVEAAVASGLELNDLYEPPNTHAGGHPTELGQQVIVRSVERLLEGHSDRLDRHENPYTDLFPLAR